MKTGDLAIQQPRAGLISYVLVSLPVAGYLLAASLDFEFAFLHILIGLAIFAVALINFDLSFIIIPLALTNPYAVIEDGFNLTFSEFALLIIFLAWFLRMLAGDLPQIYPRQFLITGTLIIVAAVGSLVAARFVMPAVLQIIRYIEILIFLFLLIVNGCRDEQSIRRVAMAMWVGGVIACTAGLVQFATGVVEEKDVGRVFLWHGGGFGALVAVTLWYSLAMLLNYRGAAVRIFALLAVPFTGVVLILSQTRTWIAAFVLVALFVVFVLKKVRIYRFLLTILVILLLIVTLVQTNVFGLVEEDLVEQVVSGAFRFGLRGGEYEVLDLSLLIRFNVWWHGIRYFAANPLTGVGAGNLRFDDYFTGHLAHPSSYAGYVDNQYIQFFAETGVLGGIAWIIYLLYGVSVGRQAVTVTRSQNLYGIAIGIVGSLLIFVVGSAFWVITPHHELFGIMIIQIALLYNITRLAHEKEYPGSS